MWAVVVVASCGGLASRIPAIKNGKMPSIFCFGAFLTSLLCSRKKLIMPARINQAYEYLNNQRPVNPHPFLEEGFIDLR